jgi:hypothetical protein
MRRALLQCRRSSRCTTTHRRVNMTFRSVRFRQQTYSGAVNPFAMISENKSLFGAKNEQANSTQPQNTSFMRMASPSEKTTHPHDTTTTGKIRCRVHCDFDFSEGVFHTYTCTCLAQGQTQESPNLRGRKVCV